MNVPSFLSNLIRTYTKIIPKITLISNIKVCNFYYMYRLGVLYVLQILHWSIHLSLSYRETCNIWNVATEFSRSSIEKKSRFPFRISGNSIFNVKKMYCCEQLVIILGPDMSKSKIWTEYAHSYSTKNKFYT